MFIIDFDDTLFDTFLWKKERFRPLEALGMSSKLIQETYTKIRNTPGVTYTNEGHAELLSTYGFPREEILRVFAETSRSEFIQQFLFPDAMPALESLKRIDQHLVLVTHGDPSFQKIKVSACGIEHFFENIFFADKNKEVIVQSIVEKNTDARTIWFINDKVEETKQVVALCPQLRPVMKVCAGFPVADYTSSGFPYFSTLSDIVQYVKQH